jgi:hypothetical protein
MSHLDVLLAFALGAATLCVVAGFRFWSRRESSAAAWGGGCTLLAGALLLVLLGFVVAIGIIAGQ